MPKDRIDGTIRRVRERCRMLLSTQHNEIPIDFPRAQFLALGLMARTLSNASAVVALLRADHNVEARTILRCCFENMFLLAAVKEEPDKYTSLFVNAADRSRKQRLQALLRAHGAEGVADEIKAQMQKMVADIESRHGKGLPSDYKHRDAAKAGGIEEAYVFYQFLSADAAHPTAFSLEEQLDTRGQLLKIVTRKPVTAENRADAKDMLCGALIACGTACAEILGDQDSVQHFRELHAEYAAVTRKPG